METYLYINFRKSIGLDKDDVWMRSLPCIVYLKALFGVWERKIHGSLDALFNLARQGWLDVRYLTLFEEDLN